MADCLFQPPRHLSLSHYVDDDAAHDREEHIGKGKGRGKSQGEGGAPGILLQGGHGLGDDPGANSSQNEQDNRHIARLAYTPIFEPANPSRGGIFTTLRRTDARPDGRFKQLWKIGYRTLRWKVEDPNGDEMYFRFYDAEVLRSFLATATYAEAADFFGPVTRLFGVFDEEGKTDPVIRAFRKPWRELGGAPR